MTSSQEPILQRLIEDIATLKKMALKTASPEEQADQFRKDRVYDVLAGRGPAAMMEGAKVFLHIVPLTAEPIEPAITDPSVSDQARNVGTLCLSGSFYRFNNDGYIVFDSRNRNAVDVAAYIQFFRDGRIEFCDMGVLSPFSQGDTVVRPVRIPWFEEKVIENLGRFQAFLNHVHISYPIMVFSHSLG